MHDVPFHEDGRPEAGPPGPDRGARSLGELRWRCRRGMKELDELLRRYVDEEFGTTSAADQDAFWRLLDSQDTILYAYFLGTERPPADLLALVERITATAGQRATRTDA